MSSSASQSRLRLAASASCNQSWIPTCDGVRPVSRQARAGEQTGLGVKALAIQADSADAEAVVAAVERTVGELSGRYSS